MPVRVGDGAGAAWLGAGVSRTAVEVARCAEGGADLELEPEPNLDESTSGAGLGRTLCVSSVCSCAQGIC